MTIERFKQISGALILAAMLIVMLLQCCTFRTTSEFTPQQIRDPLTEMTIPPFDIKYP